MDVVYVNCTVAGYGEIARRVAMRVESRGFVWGSPPREVWAGRLVPPAGEALRGGAEYAVAVHGGWTDDVVRVLAARRRAGSAERPAWYPFVGVGPPPVLDTGY